MKGKKMYSCVIRCPKDGKACIEEDCHFFSTYRMVGEEESRYLLSQDNPMGLNAISRGRFCKACSYRDTNRYVLWSMDDTEGLNNYLEKNKLFIKH